jgi:predicted TIM-barrel fold metal-dependent hydrolase
MEDFEIIDAHVHLSRTMEEDIGYHPVPGRRAVDRYATPERALQLMDMEKISTMVFLTLPPGQYRAPLAEKAAGAGLPEDQRHKVRLKVSEQMAPVMHAMNEWGCRVGRQFPRLIPFICLARELGGAEEMVAELVTRVGQGARGVKLHPGQFSFFPDDDEMWPVYEKCQELGLPIISDSAPYTYVPMVSIRLRTLSMYYSSWSGLPRPENDYGEPKNFAKVLKAFPRLNLVLAHLGAPWWDERIELAREFPNVYFDTAQGFSAPDMVPANPHRGLAEEDLVRVMRKIGVDRIIFGTDYPFMPIQSQLEQILRLPLTDVEKRQILSENARRILHL